MLQTSTGAGVSTIAQSMQQARAAELLSNWRLTPATLMARLDPSWIPAPWLQYLSFKIAQCIAKGGGGLLISAPPRHGKSMLSTIATPLWTLENFPDRNVVIATYGEELSSDFSRQVRDLILNNQDILNVRLRNDTQRVTNFLTTKGGGLKAVGLRGAITGRGANVLIIDDYIKEPKEAMSHTYLEDLWTWYRTVARTRLEPGAVVIILATRWVTNDIHGRIMRQQAESGRNFFEYIAMPAIYEPQKEIGRDDNDRPIMAPDHEAVDVVGRRYGEVLFPARYNRETVYDIKIELGSRWFNAMFQQEPDSDENAVIDLKWFKNISRSAFSLKLDLAAHRHEQIVWGRGWDFASLKDAGDFTAGPRCAYNKVTEEFYIEDMIRGQFSADKAEQRFQKAVVNDCKEYPGIRGCMEQEPGSSGTYALRHFRGIARDREHGVPGYAFEGFPAAGQGSKLLRAQPFLAALEAGKVYIVRPDPDPNADGNAAALYGGGDWQKTLLDEAEFFPEGAHDDQIDALALTYNLLAEKKRLGASIGRKGAGDTQKSAENTRLVPVLGKNHGKTRSSVTFGRK